MRYGDGELQHADLRRPGGRPLATVVLLHGGYWKAGYLADQMDPLADRLTALGFATWNVEYRSVGSGGGWPGTLTDAAAAVDRLAAADLARQGLAERVLLLGHSAGGQLAAWAASRTSTTPGGVPQVRPAAVVSLSGVLDLTAAAAAVPGSGPPTTDLLGGGADEVPARYRGADPALLAPAACPVWAVHAADDQVVPREQSSGYVAKARAAGGRARLVVVPGDHFSLIDPGAPSFPTLERLLRRSATGS